MKIDTCPKCGGPASKRWDGATDKLKMTCQECGYWWVKEPLDSKKSWGPGGKNED